MLIYFIKKRRFFAEICLFAVLLTLCVSVKILTRAGDGSGEATLFFLSGEEENTYVLCISPPLSALCGETEVALDTVVVIPEGYEVSTMTLSDVCGHMVLTCGRAEETGRIRILMDGAVGRAEQGAYTALMILRLSPTDVPMPVAALTVDPERSRLYALGEREILTWELDAVPSEISGDETSEETSSEADTAETFPEADTAETFPETEAAETASLETTPSELQTEAIPSVHEPKGDAGIRFMGCQETSVSGGSYGVRFIFCGDPTGTEGIMTPVFCSEGGGVLRVSVESALTVTACTGGGEKIYGAGEGACFFLCTFWGLDAERRYVFWLHTEEDILQIVYENGRFVGMKKP